MSERAYDLVSWRPLLEGAIALLLVAAAIALAGCASAPSPGPELCTITHKEIVAGAVVPPGPVSPGMRLPDRQMVFIDCPSRNLLVQIPGVGFYGRLKEGECVTVTPRGREVQIERVCQPPPTPAKGTAT